MKDYKLIYFTDDDHDDLSLMQEITHSLGHRPKLFSSGHDMLAFLESQPEKPHIIFLDITMPQIDGIEILEKLRKMEKFKDIPVVIHSSNCSDQYISTCYDLRANYFMRKAFTLNGLKSTLEHAINKDWNTFKADRNEFFYQY